MLCVSPAPARKVKRNGGQNIKVFVRSRPLNDIEKRSKSHNIVTCSGREVEVKDRPHPKRYAFDRVFDSNSKQRDVYNTVAAPLVDEVLNGFNCTIFAYGQTGTGKTFTMEGDQGDILGISADDSPLAGIIPRCVNQLFDELRVQKVEFTMRVSFLELYNEELFDLLSAHDDLSKLRLYEDSARKGSCIIQGLSEALVRNKCDVYRIIDKGSKKRQTAATLMNATSSRSHTVFTVTVHIKENTEEGDELLRTGKLHLVDLAGSENIGRSGAIDKRAREAGNINMSLLTLGRVITSLVEKAPHIPYRESKLTRLLQDALGGRTKTSIIATISPASCNLEETLSTLDYAHRAKDIKNRPEVNVKLNQKEVLQGYSHEIDRLRRDLLAMHEKDGVYINPEDYQEMMQKMEHQTTEITEKITQIRFMETEKSEQEKKFEELTEQFDETTVKLGEMDESLHKTKETLSATQTLLSHTAQEKDEQIYLVNAHKKTESTLHEQGYRLVNVAQVTTGDIDLLQSKLEKKADIDSMNEELASEFLSNFGASAQAIRGDFVNFIVEQQELGLERAKEIGGVSTSNETTINEKLTFIKNMNELQELGFADIKDCFKKEQNELNTLNKGCVESSLKLCEESESCLNSLREECIPSFEKIGSVASEQKNDVYAFQKEHSEKINEWRGLCTENNVKMSEINKEVIDNIVSFSIGYDSDVCQIKTDIINKHKVEIEKQAENILSVENRYKTLLEESTNNRSKLSSLMSDVNSIRKEMEAKISKVEREIEVLQLRECDIGTDSLKLNADIRSQREDYDKKVSEFASQLPHLLESLQDRVKDVNTFSMERCNSAINASMAHNNDALSLSKYGGEQIYSFAENMTGKTNEIGSVCCRQKSFVDENLTANSTVITKQRSSIGDYLTKSEEMSVNSWDKFNEYIERESKSLTSNLIRLEVELKENEKKISTSICDINGRLKSNSAVLERFFESHDDHLKESEDRVQFLLMKDMGKYVPTGFTPARKEYGYPKSLAATSPHERLLSRYRTQLHTGSKIPLPSLSFEENDDFAEPADVSGEKMSPLLSELDTACENKDEDIKQKITRSGSFKEPYLPPPFYRQASREDMKIKSAPISRSSSTSSIGDTKENSENINRSSKKRELRPPSQSKIYTHSNEKLNDENQSRRDVARVRRVLGTFN